MRRKARTDSNHKSIMESFRKCGCMVASLHQLGGGIPDLVVQISGTTVLVEVKATKKSSLTDPQKDFHNDWKVYIIISPEDVAALVSSIRVAQLSAK